MITIDVVYTDDVKPRKHNAVPSPMPPIFQTFGIYGIDSVTSVEEQIEKYLDWPVEATKAEISFNLGLGDIVYEVRREIKTTDKRRRTWDLGEDPF